MLANQLHEIIWDKLQVPWKASICNNHQQFLYSQTMNHKLQELQPL